MKIISLTDKEWNLFKSFMKALSSDSVYPLDGWAVTEEENKIAKRFLSKNNIKYKNARIK